MSKTVFEYRCREKEPRSPRDRVVRIAVRRFLHRLPPDDLGHRFARETLSPATRDFDWVGFDVPDLLPTGLRALRSIRRSEWRAKIGEN